MKVRILAILALFALAACQPKSENIAEKLKKQSEDIQKETDKKIEDINKGKIEAESKLSSGGLPATVNLSKILIKDSSAKELQPIDQIKVNLSTGLGKDGKKANIDTKKLVQLDDSASSAAAEPIPAKTYINLGCSNLSAADTGDLKLVKARISRDTFFLNAARVFVCGKQVSKHLLTLVSANEFFFSDASIDMKDNAYSMVIRAKTLVLYGKNKISHKGKPSSAAFSSVGPQISILVDEKLHGTGELEISSEGSSFQATEAPNTSAEPKKEDKKTASLK